MRQLGKINSNRFVISSLIFILIVNLPYFILGGDSYFNFIYDSMDSVVVAYKLLVESGNIFSSNSTIIHPALCGIPRGYYPSEFSIITWLYIFFGASYANIVNILLIQITAFLGMFLFLRNQYVHEDFLLCGFVSLIFSFLPFYYEAGISVAGIPLILYAYSSAKKNLPVSILIAVYYSFYSIFALTGLFLFLILVSDQLFKLVKGRFSIKQGAFILIFILATIPVIYRQIWSILSPEFISHRVDFVIPTFNFTQACGTLMKILFGEYGHNEKKPLFILLSLFILLVVNIINKKKIDVQLQKVLLLILAISIISVVFQSTFFYNTYTKIVVLKSIQLQRFYWLLPPIYYVLFFLVLKRISKIKYGKHLVILILATQLVFVFSSITNIRQIVKTKLLHKEAGVITFNKFYSSSLYQEVNNYIGKPQNTYRTASIGLQPAAALYNGFYTVDGYYGNYPKKYKDKIFEIIKPELQKDSSLYKFFTNWGSVCIIPSAELINRKYDDGGYVLPVVLKSDNITEPIHNLSVNTKLLKDELNCQYIFSSVQISNDKELGLKYHRVFENADSPYRIYLYELN